MRSQKNGFTHLYKFLTNFYSRIRAADVAADMPLTCRCHTADVAADNAADVALSEHPESRNFSPTPVLIWLQKLASQKRSWGFA